MSKKQSDREASFKRLKESCEILQALSNVRGASGDPEWKRLFRTAGIDAVLSLRQLGIPVTVKVIEEKSDGNQS